MRKSSVYLPDDLKAGLADLARRSGRSEAELIRAAIETLVRTAATGSAPAPVAVPAVPTGPVLIGVGVGPGDPALVTERALAVLRSADTVVAATTAPDAIGRAETVVRAVAPEVVVDRLVITIADDQGARSASLTRAADELVARLDGGRAVAMVVLGDPNVFSVFPAVAAAVSERRPQLTVRTVPGIMGFQALAADSATVLADGDDELTVVSLGRDADRVGPMLADAGRTVVVYKGGRHLPAVAKALDEHGRLDGAVLGELLGLPGGRSGPVAEAADRPASYLATVIVPARRNDSVISFVGAGPGAADLLTLRAVDRLAAADVVIWAGSLISSEVLEHCRPDAVRFDSKGMTLEEVTAVFERHDGAAIVRLHSGDPSVYGAIAEQLAWCVRHERAFEVVPGVSSLAAAAAAAQRELTVPGLAQSVVLTRLADRTAASVPERETVRAFAALGPTMALFLSAARPAAFRAELLAAGSAYRPDTPAVIVHRASWPDERVVATTVDGLADALGDLGATTTVLILVGDALAPPVDPQRSHVYDPTYAHSFRGERAGSADDDADGADVGDGRGRTTAGGRHG